MAEFGEQSKCWLVQSDTTFFERIGWWRELKLKDEVYYTRQGIPVYVLYKTEF